MPQSGADLPRSAFRATRRGSRRRCAIILRRSASRCAQLWRCVLLRTHGELRRRVQQAASKWSGRTPTGSVTYGFAEHIRTSPASFIRHAASRAVVTISAQPRAANSIVERSRFQEGQISNRHLRLSGWRIRGVSGRRGARARTARTECYSD
jgi:hypothetical protein